MMRTVVASASNTERRWHVIDAEGQVLGRVATLAARLLQGKHKAIYTPYIDTGDHVVVVNAGAVKLTGRKEDQKIYRRHSGYEGGLREERAVRRPQAPAGAARRRSGARHVAQDQDGRRDVPQAQGLREGGSSARRAATRSPSRSSNVGQHRILRNRSPQDVGRPRVPPSRNRHHHRQPPRVPELLPDRAAAHAGASGRSRSPRPASSSTCWPRWPAAA